MRKKMTTILMLTCSLIVISAATFVIYENNNFQSKLQGEIKSVSVPVEVDFESSKFNDTLSTSISTTKKYDTSQTDRKYSKTSASFKIKKGLLDSKLYFGRFDRFESSRISYEFDKDIFMFIPRGGVFSTKIDGKELMPFDNPSADFVKFDNGNGNLEYSFRNPLAINETFEFKLPEIATHDYFQNSDGSNSNKTIERYNSITSNGQKVDYSSIVIKASFYYDSYTKLVEYEIRYSSSGDKYTSKISVHGIA